MTQIDFTKNNDIVEFVEESQFSIVWKFCEVMISLAITYMWVSIINLISNFYF